jgi:phospholipid N-methyltransferase
MFKNADIAAWLTLGGMRAVRTRCAIGWRRTVRALEGRPAALFLRQYVAHPNVVGSVWPSSPWLVRSMARPIPAQGDGLVIELGAGTGVVTRALLDRGIAPERLRVIEREPTFVRRLRRRFPGLHVIQGDARKLGALLDDGAPVDAIVSSLPLRAFESKDVDAVLGQWRTLLRPGGQVVQFTYVLVGGELEGLRDGFAECERRIVWANVPPAKLTVFTRVV